MQSLDIVDLLEKNPITKLTNTYQNKLLIKIKEFFTENEQQLFLTSFYCFLNHNKLDFVIDLDDIWKWLGYKEKSKSKILLEKNFKKDIDYLTLVSKDKRHNNGGHNREIFMMNITTFKKLCVLASTTKAKQIHLYYLKLEELLHEVIDEQCIEAQQQLKIVEARSIKDKETLILQNFPDDKQCVYYATIDDKNEKNENLIKFGYSNKLRDRIKAHKRTFKNFQIINAFEVKNGIQVENALKNNPMLKEIRRSVILNGDNYTEMIINNSSFYTLDKMFIDVIKNVEYSHQHYNTLTDKIMRLECEEKILTDEIIRLNELIKSMQYKQTIEITEQNIEITEEKSILTDVISTPEDENLNASILPQETKIKKKRKMNKERCINNVNYKSLFGTREEVWDGTAYKTIGDLTKDELALGKNDKIVSKKRQDQGRKNHSENTKLFRK